MVIIFAMVMVVMVILIMVVMFIMVVKVVREVMDGTGRDRTGRENLTFQVKLID